MSAATVEIAAPVEVIEPASVRRDYRDSRYPEDAEGELRALVTARNSARRRASQLLGRVLDLENLLTNSRQTVECAREDSDMSQVAAAYAGIQVAERLLAQLRPDLEKHNSNAATASQRIGQITHEANGILDALESARRRGSETARLPDGRTLFLPKVESALAALIGPPVSQG